jgi:hypothetical protein
LPEVTVKVFKKCCISIAIDRTNDDMLWDDSEEDGNVRSVRKMKAFDCEDGDGDSDG